MGRYGLSDCESRVEIRSKHEEIWVVLLKHNSRVPKKPLHKIAFIETMVSMELKGDLGLKSF